MVMQQPPLRYEALLATQKNEVLECLDKAGLNPKNFTWIMLPSKYTSKLMVEVLHHTPSKFFFVFDKSNGYNPKRVARYSPAAESINGSQYRDSWYDMKQSLIAWLRYLKRELSAPNLWEEVYKLGEVDAWGEDNSKFTPAEVKIVVQRVEAVRTYLLSEPSITEEVAKEINNKLDYLVAATKKSGRRDWLMMFVGTLVSEAVKWAITPERLKHAYTLLTQVLLYLPDHLPK